mgnify:CR=1 FL=1
MAGDERSGPWYYFVPYFSSGCCPGCRCSSSAPGAHGATARPNALGFSWQRFALSWAAFVFAFFSASGSKLPSYILPMFPPLALVVGWLLGAARYAHPVAPDARRWSPSESRWRLRSPSWTYRTALAPAIAVTRGRSCCRSAHGSRPPSLVAAGGRRSLLVRIAGGAVAPTARFWPASPCSRFDASGRAADSRVADSTR